MQVASQPMAPTRTGIKEIDWVGSIPFIIMHICAFCAFFWEFDARAFWLCFASYYIRMIAVTAGYHRYFAHRAYKTSRLGQFVIGFLAETSAQKGCLWWAANHRHHHKYSDTDHDLHSPKQHGFWWAQVGWILSPNSIPTNWKYIQDFAKYPELRWLNKFNLVPPTIYAVSMWLICGWSGLFWGFFFSTMLLFHGTFVINSLTHMMGRVRYRSGDGSRNSFLLALVTCGEGWHNNHHYYQATASQGWFWWELDLSYYVLKVCSWFGLVWDLRQPPPHVKAKTIASESERAAA